MSQNAASFVGSIPKHYDSGLGPNIFTDYADLITDTCCGASPSRVLELAAGTGIVSRKLRDRLPKDTALMVTDLNPPMLEIAKRKFAEDEPVDFAVADAMNLPFEPASFDLMVCQFGVMFFPDKPASFREALRVLTPNGRYVFNVWGAMADNPFAQIAQDVGARFFPDDPPRFLQGARPLPRSRDGHRGSQVRRLGKGGT
jgi:SAM-dependent methyltransferase